MPIDPQKTVEFYKQVLLFNTLAGNDKRPYGVAKPHQEKLCQEEWEETLKAFEEKDAVEFLDGIIDSMVVEVYHYYLNSSEGELLDVETVCDASYTFNDLKEQRQETFEGGYFLGALELFCNTLKDGYQVDIEGAMKEVMDSNMSKFVPEDFAEIFPSSYHFNEWVTYLAQHIYTENKGRYTGIYAELVKTEHGNYYVFKDDNGKVMKGPLYRKPDLKPFVGNLDKFFEDESENIDMQKAEEVLEEVKQSPLDLAAVQMSAKDMDRWFEEMTQEIEAITAGEKEPKKSYGLMLTEREAHLVHRLLGYTVTSDGVAQDLSSRLDDMLFPDQECDDWDRYQVYDVEANRMCDWMFEIREVED